MLRNKMYSLLQTKERDIPYTELARIIEKDSSLMTKFFNHETELSFGVWVNSVKVLAPNNFDDEMLEIIDIMIVEDSSPSIIRCAMDFLFNKRQFDKLTNAITILLDSGNKDKKDWAKLWQVALKHVNRENYCELLAQLDSIHPNKKNNYEAFVLKKLLEIYCYYHKKQYSIMFEKAECFGEYLENIKNCYLRASFSIKYKEVMANSYMFAKGNLRLARELATEVINSELICAKFKFNSYYIMGMSLAFEDYKASVEHLNYYIALLKSQNKHSLVDRVLNDDLAFLQIFWGKDLDKFRTNDKFSQALYEAKYGDKQKALELIASESGGYVECIQGIANNNPALILKSMTTFEREEKNLFLYRFPLLELKNYNGFKEVAEQLIEKLPN